MRLNSNAHRSAVKPLGVLYKYLLGSLMFRFLFNIS